MPEDEDTQSAEAQSVIVTPSVAETIVTIPDIPFDKPTGDEMVEVRKGWGQGIVGVTGPRPSAAPADSTPEKSAEA